MLETPCPSLAERTTLHLGGKALAELCPENTDDLALLDENVRRLGGIAYPLGRGSNLLAEDGDLPFVLINLRLMQKILILHEEDGKIQLRADAGVPLGRLLRFCLARGYSGLEGLVGIPGNVGGACAMNAGSFGTNIGDCLSALEVYSDGEIVVVPRDRLKMGYRSMMIENFAQLPLIVRAIFTLTNSSRNVMFGVMNQDLLQKKSRQPVAAATAGCTFRNPSSGVSAGRLLDEAGFRGRQLGGMAFSGLHANFLINCGNGTSREARELIDLARTEVHRRTGIVLEHEIRFLECPS